MRTSLLCLVALFWVSTAYAADSIFMNISGVTCSPSGNVGEPGISVLSWQWGASNPITIGSTTVSKTNLSALTVTRTFDECSPLLLPKLFAGQKLATVTLTQYGQGTGASGGGPVGSGPNATPTPLMVVTLTNVAFSQYSIGGTSSTDPVETWSLVFGQVCIKNIANGAQACWNALQNAP
jgi:type VI protein secretion system component Hcp